MEEYDIRHYWSNYPFDRRRTKIYPCGTKNKFKGNAIFRHVTCEKCKETQEYKDALYEFEIGFDCNEEAYLEYLRNK